MTWWHAMWVSTHLSTTFDMTAVWNKVSWWYSGRRYPGAAWWWPSRGFPGSPRWPSGKSCWSCSAGDYTTHSKYNQGMVCWYHWTCVSFTTSRSAKRVHLLLPHIVVLPEFIEDEAWLVRQPLQRHATQTTKQRASSSASLFNVIIVSVTSRPTKIRNL